MTYNIKISGDEARLLLALLVKLPVFELYQKLNEISMAQPPKDILHE